MPIIYVQMRLKTKDQRLTTNGERLKTADCRLESVYYLKKLTIMRKYSFIILLSAGLFLFSCTHKNVIHEREGKPNIILIMTDDQGIGDIGYMGNPYIKTPVLDSLASSAIILSNFYVSPVCAPTRSSLLTGRYSLRTGIHDTYNGGATMAADEYTLAEILSVNGYKTGMFGKWHLGDNYPFRPSDQGFEESLYHPSGGIGQVGDINNYYRFDSSYTDPVLYYNNELYQSKGYCSDVFTDFAVRFIEKNRNNPFFLYLSFNAPHTPLQVPEEYYEMYRDLQSKLSKEEDPEFYGKILNESNIDAARRVYGMVNNIDDNIGSIIKSLEQDNLYKNTIIIFLTDNGPQQNRYRCGLRGLKGSVYEGGIKVPAFIIYPGNQEGDIKHTLAHIDILPTIMELINLDFDPVNKIDGISFAPLLEGHETDTFHYRPLIYNWQRGYPEPYRNIAIRKGGYKLVGQTAYITDLELYHIADDPLEKNNIISEKPTIARDLRQEFDLWYRDIIREENLRKPLAPVAGTEYQDEVILNRNDAKGPPGIWSQDEIYGYWDISFAKSGPYKIKVRFRDSIPSPGRLTLKISPVQRTAIIGNTGLKEYTFSNVFILEGDYVLDCWYEIRNGRRIMPFYITVSADKSSGWKILADDPR